MIGGVANKGHVEGRVAGAASISLGMDHGIPPLNFQATSGEREMPRGVDEAVSMENTRTWTEPCFDRVF